MYSSGHSYPRRLTDDSGSAYASVPFLLAWQRPLLAGQRIWVLSELAATWWRREEFLAIMRIWWPSSPSSGHCAGQVVTTYVYRIVFWNASRLSLSKFLPILSHHDLLTIFGANWPPKRLRNEPRASFLYYYYYYYYYFQNELTQR